MPTHPHKDKHFPFIHTHTHTHTHTYHTPCAPLQAQGRGGWVQCPEAPGASPAEHQAGKELVDELRGHGGLPSCTETPFPWRRAGALNTELPQNRRASGACDSLTSHCERRVCSLLRHSTCGTLFSLMSILQHLGSHPIVSRRKYRLKEVK